MDVVSFDLQLEAWSGSAWTLDASPTGVVTEYYDFTGLTAETLYRWRVRAVDGAETSDWSAWVEVTTLAGTVSVTVDLTAGQATANGQTLVPAVGAVATIEAGQSLANGQTLVPAIGAVEAIEAGQSVANGQALVPQAESAGVPQNVRWLNITSTSARLAWDEAA